MTVVAPPPPVPEDSPPDLGDEKDNDGPTATESILAELTERDKELGNQLESLYLETFANCKTKCNLLLDTCEGHKATEGRIVEMERSLRGTSDVAEELSGQVRTLDQVQTFFNFKSQTFFYFDTEWLLQC